VDTVGEALNVDASGCKANTTLGGKGLPIGKGQSRAVRAAPDVFICLARSKLVRWLGMSHEDALLTSAKVDFIIRYFGVADQQKGNRAWTSGDLTFERTNTGHTELRLSGQLVLSLPLPGSNERVIWQPGDWVSEVDAIYRGIKR
jgi:hypothetical protein